MTEPTENQVDNVDSDAAFEAGYNGTAAPAVATEPVVETPVVEPTPEAQTEAPAAETPPEDPIASVKAELESMKGRYAALEKVPDRLRNIEGHIGGINSQLKQAALATAKAVEKTGGDAPTQTQVQAAGSSSTKWKALTEEYPEWAEAMEERLAEMRAAIPQPAAPDLTGFRTEVNASVSQQIAKGKQEARALALIDLKHEGWEETVNTTDFKAWYVKQAPEMKALASSTKPKDAIAMLDAFKAAGTQKAPDKEQKTQRLRSAITPQGVPAATPTTINDDEAFERGYNQA